MKTQTFGTVHELSARDCRATYSVFRMFARSVGHVLGFDDCSSFLAARTNGTDADSPSRSYNIPEDGNCTWLKGEVKGANVYGVEIRSGPDKGKYEYEVRYDAGPGDLAWFEERDRNYLTRILKEGKLRELEPAVWYMRCEERAQDTDIGERWSQKLKLPNLDALLKRAEEAEKQLRETGGTPPWEERQPPTAGGGRRPDEGDDIEQLRAYVEQAIAQANETQGTFAESVQARFEYLVEKYEAELTTLVDQQQSRFDDTIDTLSSQYAAKAEELLEAQSDRPDLGEEDLRRITSEVREALSDAWEEQAQDLLNQQHTAAQLHAQEHEVMKSIVLRQGTLETAFQKNEITLLDFEDKTDETYRKLLYKKNRLAQQQDLQRPKQLKVFYNAIEQRLVVKLYSALQLAVGMMQGKDKKASKRGKAVAKITGALLGSVPVVGNLLNAAYDLACEEGINYVTDKVQQGEYDSVSKALTSFKKADRIAERIARHIAQRYKAHIESQTDLTESTAINSGHKAADAIYTFLKEGRLRRDKERMPQLFDAVEALAKSDRWFLRSGGRCEAEAPPPMDPSSARGAQEAALRAAERQRRHTAREAGAAVDELGQLRAENDQRQIAGLEQGLQVLRAPQPPAAGGGGDALGDDAPPASASGRVAQQARAHAIEAGMFRAPTRSTLGLPEARTQTLRQFKEVLSENRLDARAYQVKPCGDISVEVFISSEPKPEDDPLLSKLSACLERALGSTVIRRAGITDGVFRIETSNSFQKENLVRFLQESGLRLVIALAPSEAGSASPSLAVGGQSEE